MQSTPSEFGGLSDLENRRVRPARNPKLPVTVPPAPTVPEPAAESPAAPKRLRAAARPTVRGVQVYLDAEADRILRECRDAGEVSNSAVMRLALATLRAQMSPQEIVRTLLIDDNPARRSPGRKPGS